MSNYWNDNLIDDSWLNGGSTPPPLATLRALYDKASGQKNADELQRKIAQIIDIKLKEIDTKNQYAEVSDNDMLAGVSHIKDNSPDNSEVYTDHFSSVLDSRLDKIKRSYDEFDALAPNEVLQLKTLSLVSQKLGRNESADIQQMIAKETTDEKVKENIFEASLSATEKEADEIRKGLALGTYSLSAEDKEIIYGRLMQHAGFENAAQNDKALETSVLDSFDVYDKKGNLSPLYEGCVELASKIQYEFPEGTSADEQARLTKMYNEQLLANAGQRAAQNILKEKDFLQRYGTTEEISAAYKQRIAQQFERSAVLAGLASNEETGVLAKDIVVDKQTGKVSYKGDSQADIAGAIGKIMDGQAKINPFAVRMDSMDLEKETKEVSKQLNLKRVKEEKLSFWKKRKKDLEAVTENLVKKGGWKKVAANALAFGGSAALMAGSAPLVAAGAAIYAGATAANAFVMPVYDTLNREMYEKGVKGLGNRLKYLKENWKRARTEKYAEKDFMKRAWIKTAGGIAVGAATFGLGVGGLRGTLQGTVARQGTMAGGKMASLLSSIKMLSKAQREAKKARTVATVKALQTAKGYVKGDAIALSAVAVSALTTDIIKFSGQMQNLPQEAQANVADIQKETAAINTRVGASVDQPAPQHAAEMAQPAPQQAVEMPHARAAATVEKTVVQQNITEKISSLRGRMYGKLDDIVKPVKFEHELPKVASKADYLAQLRGTAEPVVEPKPIVTEYGIQMPEPEQEFVPEPVNASYEELYGKNGPVFEGNISENSYAEAGHRMAGMPEDAAASEPGANEFYGDDDRRTSSFAAAREKAQSSFSNYSKAAFERQQAAAEKVGSSNSQEFGKTFQEAQERYNSLKESALKSMAAREPEIPPEIKTKAENTIGGLMKDWEKTNETVSAPNVGPNGEYPSYDGKKFSELTAEEKTALQSDWIKDAQKALMKMETEKAAAAEKIAETAQVKELAIDNNKIAEELAKPWKEVEVHPAESAPVMGLPKEEYEGLASNSNFSEEAIAKAAAKVKELGIDNNKIAEELAKPWQKVEVHPAESAPVMGLPKEEYEGLAKLNENAPVNAEAKGTELPVENKAAEAPVAEKSVENAAESAQLHEGASVSKNPWGIERTRDKEGNIKVEYHMTQSDMYKMYAKMNPEHRAAYDQMQTDYTKAENFVTRMGGRRVVAKDVVAGRPFVTSESQEELYGNHLRDLNNYAKENGCEFIRTKEGKYVLTKDGYCSQEFGNDAVFEKAANVGKTPEEIAKNPFKVPDIGNKPETPKKGFIGRFKNNGGR